MAWGGKRRNAGRRKGKTVHVPSPGKGIASQVLESIGEYEYWRFLLRAEEMADPEKRKLLSLAERQEIADNLIYLKNCRDGKPAQSVIMADTRESARELEFGNLPMPAAPEPGTAGKPN